jgi:hypothetical protein
VLLCYAEDLSPNEVARRQGIPAATVRSRLKRGLAELRRRLQPDNDRRFAWAIPAAKGLLLMKASSKTGLVVIAAVLLLLAGTTTWRLVTTSRSVASDESRGEPVAAQRSANRRSGTNDISVPRLRGAAIGPSTADPPDGASAKGSLVEGTDEPEVRLRGRVLDRLRRPVAGAVVIARADLQAGLSTNASHSQSDSTGHYESPDYGPVSCGSRPNTPAPAGASGDRCEPRPARPMRSTSSSAADSCAER